MLTASTTKELTGITRKFFWGAINKDRFIAYVSWEKICAPYEEGGLAVRDFKKMNTALVLKLVWGLASGSQALWAQTIRAKYCSRRGLWGVSGTANSSPLWKDIQATKSFFQGQITWQFGNGSLVKVKGEPWFLDWDQEICMTDREARTTVAEITIQETGEWDEAALESLLSPAACQKVIATKNPPNLQSIASDMLVWSHTPSGRYSVRDGYRVLSQGIAPHSRVRDPIWGVIWNGIRVVPKIKIFLWRLVRGAVPVASCLHRRIRSVPPLCQLCGKEDEFTNHLLFFCEWAQATWLLSPFALISNGLPVDTTEALLQLLPSMTVEQQSLFCNLLWVIWKQRNMFIFEGKRVCPQLAISQAKAMLTPQEKTRAPREVPQQYHLAPAWSYVMMDASYDQSGTAGIAILAYNHEGVLQWVHVEATTATSAFQAETLAMIGAIRAIKETSTPLPAVLCTDSSKLRELVVTRQPNGAPHWEAVQALEQCIKLRDEGHDGLQITHVYREHLVGPHNLANWARRTTGSIRGYPCSVFLSEMAVPESLPSVFQLNRPLVSVD